MRSSECFGLCACRQRDFRGELPDAIWAIAAQQPSWACRTQQPTKACIRTAATVTSEITPWNMSAPKVWNGYEHAKESQI